MPFTRLNYVKRCAEWQEFDEDTVRLIPHNTRGIYVLLQERPNDEYEVLYVGMAGAPEAGIRGRLLGHLKSDTKTKLCTHFSIFEMQDNINEDQIKELEGLFRHIYRKDRQANLLNKARAFHAFYGVRTKDLRKWPAEAVEESALKG